MMTKVNMHESLVEILERASYLSERVSHEFIGIKEGTPHGPATLKRLERWKENVAKGNDSAFLARLSNEKMRWEDALKAVGQVRLIKKDTSLPSWLRLLEDVMETGALKALNRIEIIANESLKGDRCLDPNAPIPFEDILLAFVLVARQRLERKLGATYSLLGDAVHATLERSLILHLSRISGKTLLLEFSVFKVRQRPKLLFEADLTMKLDKSIGEYLEFSREQLRLSFLPLFQDYSVLARLLATATEFWIESQAEFLSHLESDYATICDVFHSGSDPGGVIEVKTNLSDPHNNGRVVSQVKFQSGLKLVYKPRDIAIEVAFNSLLTWLNEAGLTPDMKVLTTLSRDDHGWVEFAAQLPCVSHEMATAYYRRSGMLLGLLYILSGKDFHFENIVAHGEYIVPIDMEMLLYPLWQSSAETDAVIVADEKVTRSVLNIGLLPMWDTLSSGQKIDISALGWAKDLDRKAPQERWIHPNTDMMDLLFEEHIVVSPHNESIVYMNGVVLSPNEYLKDIVDGFSYIYTFLLDHRERLLALDVPVSAFKQLRTRFILRRTRLYARLLNLSYQPQYLHEGIDRSIELEVLNQAFLIQALSLPHWTLVAAEIRSLEQMDIPVFDIHTEKNGLFLGREIIIEDAFKSSGYELVLSNLRRLSRKDLDQQTSFIYCSLYTRVAKSHAAETTKIELDLQLGEPLSAGQLVEEANMLGHGLLQQAIRAGGSASWIALTYRWQSRHYHLRPISFDLYGGSAGIGLYISALSSVTHDTQLRNLAFETLRPIRQTFLHSSAMNLVNIGAAVGLGSVIYALTRCAQYLEDESMIKDANAIASQIEAKQIELDTNYDVLAGSAGLILGLLSLYSLNPAVALLERAVACGKHLLKARVKAAGGVAWPTVDGEFLTGLSHGTAGIAYALLRLFKATGEYTFREAAQEAISYEASLFSDKSMNWPDLRRVMNDNFSPRFMTSWCHGATGIGLARLATIDIINDGQIQKDISASLSNTLSYGFEERDHLCCGNFGRVELVYSAAQQLHNPDYSRTAIMWATQLVKRAKSKGTYSIFPDLPTSDFSPGLFQGRSGIGYMLLRLAYPDRFPSILIWE